jgi:hypothetical protein
MPLKTEQVEEGSPKVAMFKDRPTGNWHLFINADHERRTRESGEYEVEDFIPVSALLSDEVAQAFQSALPAEVIESEITLDEIGTAMRAAIDHLGGTDAH